MRQEEKEELEETLIVLKRMYKDITDEQLMSCLRTYIRVRRPISLDDMISFVKMIKDLNNL